MTRTIHTTHTPMANQPIPNPQDPGQQQPPPPGQPGRPGQGQQPDKQPARH